MYRDLSAVVYGTDLQIYRFVIKLNSGPQGSMTMSLKICTIWEKEEKNPTPFQIKEVKSNETGSLCADKDCVAMVSLSKCSHVIESLCVSFTHLTKWASDLWVMWSVQRMARQEKHLLPTVISGQVSTTKWLHVLWDSNAFPDCGRQ